MESIWSKACSLAEREPLQGGISAYVAVIGVGLCGSPHSGRFAALRVLGSGSGGKPYRQRLNPEYYGKITSQYGLIYHKLFTTLGEHRARQRTQANESAVAEYRRIIEARGNDCEVDKSQIKAKVENSVRLGLNASYVEETFLHSLQQERCALTVSPCFTL